ncbi:sensor histidine kinase [Sphingobium yanoikuyae]|uniref:sensor histidine kinase n=1 Tax=Sphingobium yanoikuyae TaxID=13690 RepID=UPI00241E1F80|nr:HAMP domain-containing sensor histidine kinase [Sphingobium yanoikuyae]
MRERDIFLAGFAHELRTPLTILKGRLHGLEDGVIRPESGECQRLLDQVDGLLRIVDELGTFARAHAGDLLLDYRVVVLREIVQRALDRLGPSSSITQTGLVGHEAVLLRCDPVRVAQALEILLRFAHGHLSEGGSILIAADGVGGPVLTLRCPGPAITADQAEDIFIPFFHSEDQTKSENGIGPALAAALIRAHGGDIICLPLGSENGVSFEIDIPRQPG